MLLADVSICSFYCYDVFGILRSTFIGRGGTSLARLDSDNNGETTTSGRHFLFDKKWKNDEMCPKYESRGLCLTCALSSHLDAAVCIKLLCHKYVRASYVTLMRSQILPLDGTLSTLQFRQPS